MSDKKPNVLAGRHERAEELKAQGKKLLGYLCAYCPEEIVSAAGLVPVRVFGDPGPHPLAEGRLPEYYCAHARGCLHAGLGGEYAYLDGLVFPYTCLHTQGAYESWARQNKEMYSWFIDLPSVVDTPEATEFLLEELKAFMGSLESAFGVRITDADLVASIHDGNEKRALLRRIYLLKSEPRPVVSGEEVFSLILESMTGGMGHEELSGVMANLESRERPREDRTRVMVLGTDLDDPRIFAAIEDQGAVVVADNLCTNGLHIWKDVEPEGDPLAAIAKRCLLGINCPLKHPLDLSLARVEEMVNRFRVEKAVFIWPKACDPMGWTVPFIRKMLEDRGIEHCWVAVSDEGGEDDLSRVAEAAKSLV